MRVVRFVTTPRETPRYGSLDEAGTTVCELRNPPWLGLEPGPERWPLAAVTLLAPVEPPDVIAIGLNYREHAAESKLKLPSAPVIFLKATSSVIGPDASILLPRMAPDEVDAEAELAIVIGTTCHQVTAAAAADYIFGYTCANDVSARDCQLRQDAQWARGKSFDTFCPLGPWIDTAFRPETAHVQLRVNGELWQDGATSDMLFDCHTLVSYCSQVMTLRPGTVILTGTPPGVGFARTPPRFLHANAVVEVTITGLATLRNPVAAF
jgi:2-keto-4-pentenoate hydratase/2-oxohepta-3-ene-1,7-dioic acid hydratase in catechol pathway